jgi:hypothetical protein
VTLSISCRWYPDKKFTFIAGQHQGDSEAARRLCNCGPRAKIAFVFYVRVGPLRKWHRLGFESAMHLTTEPTPEGVSKSLTRCQGQTTELRSARLGRECFTLLGRVFIKLTDKSGGRDSQYPLLKEKRPRRPRLGCPSRPICDINWFEIQRRGSLTPLLRYAILSVGSTGEQALPR